MCYNHLLRLTIVCECDFIVVPIKQNIPSKQFYFIASESDVYEIHGFLATARPR